MISASLKPKLVILDLDGVLADTYSIHVRGWSSILRSYGVVPQPSLFNDLRGIPTRQALQKLFAVSKLEVADDLLTNLVEIKNYLRDQEVEHLSPGNVHPAVLELLS